MANSKRSKSRNQEVKKPFTTKEDQEELECKGRGRKRYRNDPSWHALTPELVEDIGRKSFYHPAGTRLTLSGSGLDATQKSEIIVPGVAALQFVPSCGQTDGVGGVNLAANQVYSFVRHANSGSANYNAPDLMMYLMAEANVIMYYMHMVRLWAIGKNYSAMNRYIPEAYFKAYNVDLTSFLENPAQFKTRLDLIANKINSRAIPLKFNYPKYLSYMVAGVFKESDSEQAGQYIWLPECVFKYEGYTDKAGGKLTPVWLQPQPGKPVAVRTAQQALDVLDELVQAINIDEDMGIISGDILKAYGSDLYRISPIPYDFSLQPIKDEIMLHAIHNATFVGSPILESIVIAQDPAGSATEGGTIECNYQFFAEAPGAAVQRVIDSNTTNPAAADLVEWLRYAVIADKTEYVTTGQVSGTKVYKSTYTTTPVIVPSRFFIYTMESTGAITGFEYQTHIGRDFAPTDNKFYLDGDKIVALEKFDWHPIQYICSINNTSAGNGTKAYIYDVAGDLDVYTTFDINESRVYNDIEVFSMFVA